MGTVSGIETSKHELVSVRGSHQHNIVSTRADLLFGRTVNSVLMNFCFVFIHSNFGLKLLNAFRMNKSKS